MRQGDSANSVQIWGWEAELFSEKEEQLKVLFQGTTGKQPDCKRINS